VTRSTSDTAYGAPLILLKTAIPMLIIANAYRRLNLWNANCGASFEWVGRAINPYLGFMTGWLMLAGTLFGTLAGDPRPAEVGLPLPLQRSREPTPPCTFGVSCAAR
jgi:hypothetical protein